MTSLGTTKRTFTSAISANLAITKTSEPKPAVPGLEMTYTITVTNLGPSPVVSATVYDQLPGVFEANPAVSWLCVAPPGYACTPPAAGELILSDTVTLPASSSIVYTATGALSPSITSLVENTAVVTAPAWVTEPNHGDNRDTDFNSPAPRADLGVHKTVSDPSPAERETISYTVVVSNAGPSDAQSLTVSDMLPVTVKHVSHLESSGTYDEGTGAWDDLFTLEAGEAVTLTITCTVASQHGRRDHHQHGRDRRQLPQRSPIQ